MNVRVLRGAMPCCSFTRGTTVDRLWIGAAPDAPGEKFEVRLVLWLATMLFFVGFFSYGYLLWSRSKKRRASRSGE